MSHAAEEAPVMGLGVEQRQLLVQGLMSLASMVQQRRYALDRDGWSDERNVTRSAERTLRVAEPTVRTMSSPEWAAAAQNQARGEGSERSVVHRHGWVKVWVGPVSDDRVGLLATGGADAGRPPTVSASVSCATSDTAFNLGDELLAGGPDKVDRLHNFATLTAQRAAAAAGDLPEPEHVRHARALAAVREVWSGPQLAPLADKVVNSGAFGALAWRLHELEQRGYCYQDVLRRIDAARLLRRTVVDPAALAEYFVEQMLVNLHVINLDDVEPDRPSARSANPRGRAGRGQPGSRRARAGELGNDTAASSSQQSRQSRPGQGRAAAAGPARIRVEQRTVGPLLVEAFGQRTAELVRRDRRGYPELRRYLYQLDQQGRPVAAMLRDVPSHRLTEVARPARYVRTVVGNHSVNTPLRQTGPDRTAMEALVRDAVDVGTADKVMGCRTWPKLARHLQGFTAEGLPVTQMLGALPATRVAQAEYPASYALRLLERDATRRRTAASDGRAHAPRRPRPRPTAQQHDLTSAADSARPARAREPVSADPSAAAATPSPHPRVRAAARETRAVLAVDSGGVVDARVVEAVIDEPDAAPAVAAAAAAGPGEPAPPNTAHTAYEGQTRWTLHPDDVIDRVGLEAALGVVDSVEQVEWLEQHLGSATSATRPAGHHPAELTAGPSVSPSVSPPNPAAAPGTGEHSGDGELGGQDADGHEPHGSGGDGDRRGQRDAAERAAAAEARRAAGAAAARAEVTYTPDATAADPAETACQTRAARTPVHRPPAPHRERSPRR